MLYPVSISDGPLLMLLVYLLGSSVTYYCCHMQAQYFRLDLPLMC